MRDALYFICTDCSFSSKGAFDALILAVHEFDIHIFVEILMRCFSGVHLPLFYPRLSFSHRA